MAKDLSIISKLEPIGLHQNVIEAAKRVRLLEVF